MNGNAQLPGFVLSVWNPRLGGDVTYALLSPPTSSNLIQITFHNYKQRFVSMVIPSHMKLTIKLRHLNCENSSFMPEMSLSVV